MIKAELDTFKETILYLSKTLIESRKESNAETISVVMHFLDDKDETIRHSITYEVGRMPSD